MELITTHIGADFDALASMKAAQRLHPAARLFFPGSREESVRRMLAAGLTDIEEVRQKDVDPTHLTRLILCDSRQRDRLGVVGRWLDERPDLPVVIYDHHPPSERDVAAGGGRVDPAVGSTSTLMVEELNGRGLPVSALEATLLLMGIYEDTGSLSYPTVSPRDLAAAAWLLERGGELGAVRRFALRSLDSRRLEILHRMAEVLEIHRIHGHRVGIVALELGDYVDELAPLVSRCLELYELPLLFALFGEADRVTVIARGEVAGCDLGEVLRVVAGGGGHPTAAAGSLRGATAIEARERLLAHLESALPPAARARDLMLAPFVAVSPETPVEAAKERLNQRRINAAPVVDGEGRAVGAVTRQLLDAALQHGLGGRPVATVMGGDLEWVEPEAPAEEVGERMLGQHPRFVLVGDRRSARPLGLVTRMQVLRHLHGRLQAAGEGLDARSRELKRQRQGVAQILEGGLPPALAGQVRAIAQVAQENGVRAYLVGGLVRDLLLGRENRDLDVVVEGDGPHFARLVSAALGGRVREHDAFLTAAVLLPDGGRIDVATARSEFYRAPAALPEVQTSALRQDLYRRDFTINTLAIRLGPERTPELLDHFGGRRDLARRTLRVLHSLSFIDDPTRVLRAVRLELRLGFRISQETLRLVEVALAEGIFDRLSGSRLRDELFEILGDPMTVERGLDRLAELGLLAVVEPELSFGRRARERVRQAVAVYDWYRLQGMARRPAPAWRLFLMALGLELPAAAWARLDRRLCLVGEDRRVLAGFRARLTAPRECLERAGLAPHEAAAALEPLPEDLLLLLMAVGGDLARGWIRRYVTELAPLALKIRGGDLLACGARPGPAIGLALSRTRDARLDGRLGPDEELAYACAVLAEEERAVRAPVAAAAPGGGGG